MITTEQRTARRQYIGSSDAAAVMGLDPHRSALDVWYEKTGRAEGFEGNEHTKRGNYLEPALLAFARDEVGEFDTDYMGVSGVLCANFDGIGTNFIVEAKSICDPGEVGTPGTDEVPDRVIVQTHHGMYVAGPIYRVAWVPVIVPAFKGFEFRMYRVGRNDDLADRIAESGTRFWWEHVVPGIEPSGFKPSLEILKRVRRVPEKVVPVPDVLVDALVVARAACKHAEADKAEAERELLAALGDAEGGTYSRGVVTYLPTVRRAYSVAETTYRSLKIKAAKE